MSEKASDGNPRSKFAGIVAGLKESLSKKQDELDEAGVERKAMELSPDIIDGLQLGLSEKFPEDEQAVVDIMQIVVDVLSSVQPETDVVEEMAMGEDEEDKEDEKDNETVAALTAQVAEMGKAYNDLITDVSEIVEITHKAFDRMNAETKSFNDMSERLAKVEKSVNDKPRRASQAPETEIDPDSEIAKSLAQRTFEAPPAFADMFTGGK